MLHSGLVSITFRKLSPRQIVDLVAAAGLTGIEWGGDVHVPHGDLGRAREVHQMTEDVGLKIAAYGSYYRVGHEEPVPFEQVLDTAAELDAPTIRVWAGKKGSAQAEPDYRKKIIDESVRIAELAAVAGKTISYEYHGNTLTDQPDSARRLLEETGHPNIKIYWQPLVHLTKDERNNGLKEILPWLTNVHTYAWADTCQRLALAGDEASWKQYLKTISSEPGDHFVMIEFVKNDCPEMFFKDAETLRTWLGETRL